MQGQKSEITHLNGLLGQAVKTLFSAMSPDRHSDPFVVGRLARRVQKPFVPPASSLSESPQSGVARNTAFPGFATNAPFSPVPCRPAETAQPSSSSSSSSSSSNREIDDEDDDEDEDEDDQDVSFLFPIRPQAGGPTEP